jgi:hypothetical protein
MPFEQNSVVIGNVRQPWLQVKKNSDLNQYCVISYSQGYTAAQFNGSNTDSFRRLRDSLLVRRCRSEPSFDNDIHEALRGVSFCLFAATSLDDIIWKGS